MSTRANLARGLAVVAVLLIAGCGGDEYGDLKEELNQLTKDLRGRVDLPARTRYRLVGVGLSNFVERDDPRVQAGLFDLPPAP